MKIFTSILLIFLLQLPNEISAQSHIYYSAWGTNNIKRGNQDGSGVTQLISTSGGRGLGLDISGDKIYFCDATTNNIKKANLDGSDLIYLTAPGSSEPLDLTLDLANSNLYHTDNANGKITKINFDGTGKMDVLTGLTNPQGIDLDEASGVLYWCDSNDKTINSVNTDGTNQQVLYTSSNSPIRLALDKVNQKIYWVERVSNLIRRSDYDGSNVTTIATILVSTGIAIDNLNSKIYWNENTSDSMKRMNFDGSNKETVFSNYGLSGIALNINSVLPVELSDFSGKSSQNGIRLNWQTATELNNAHFHLQKSPNAKDWQTIATIQGQGTTNKTTDYEYEDLNPFSGINHYRLKQIDFDGTYDYSKIIAVEYQTSEKPMQVFPNPSNGLINIQIDNPSGQKMSVQVIDNQGSEVWESGMMEGESNWRKELDLDGKGIYLVVAQVGAETFYERIIVVEEK